MKNENSFSKMFRENQIRRDEREKIRVEALEADKRFAAIPDQELRRGVSVKEQNIERTKKNRCKKESTKDTEIAKNTSEKNRILEQLAKRRISKNDPILEAVLLAKSSVIYQNVIILEA